MENRGTSRIKATKKLLRHPPVLDHDSDEFDVESDALDIQSDDLIRCIQDNTTMCISHVMTKWALGHTSIYKQ